MKKRSGLVNVFETFGRSFLLPVSVLPAAGILKGIGSAFTNSSTIEMHPDGKSNTTDYHGFYYHDWLSCL